MNLTKFLGRTDPVRTGPARYELILHCLVEHVVVIVLQCTACCCGRLSKARHCSIVLVGLRFIGAYAHVYRSQVRVDIGAHLQRKSTT